VRRRLGRSRFGPGTRSQGERCCDFDQTQIKAVVELSGICRADTTASVGVGFGRCCTSLMRG
jgi:hypothetical protein